MSTIIMRCPVCGQTLTAPLSSLGSSRRCQTCNGVFIVSMSAEDEKPSRSWVPYVWATAIAGLVVAVAIGVFVVGKRGVVWQTSGAANPSSADPPLGSYEEAEGIGALGRDEEMAAAPTDADGTTALVAPRTAIGTQPQGASTRDLSPAELFAKASPAVFFVLAHDNDNRSVSLGTGFAVATDGLIVTNYHVIEDADRVELRSGDAAPIRVDGAVAVSVEADLVILKTGSVFDHILPLDLNPPVIGTHVYAIGNPQGMEKSLSDGLVSGHRTINGGVAAIQTTAAISPGSSGGPLLKGDGTVVGVTTMSRRSAQNLNLAVCASEINELLRKRIPLTPLADLPALRTKARMEDDVPELQEATDAYLANKLDRATGILDQISDDKRGTGYWLLRGKILLTSQHRGEAETALARALQRDLRNDDVLAWAALCVLASNTEGSANAARGMCDRAMRINKGNTTAYSVRAMTRDVVTPREAIADYQAALTMDPTDLGIRFNLAATYQRANQNAEALREYEAALSGCDSQDQYGIIDIRNESDKVGEFSSSRSIEVLVRLGLAATLHVEKRYAEATEMWESVRRIEPGNLVALYGLCRTSGAWGGGPYSSRAKPYNEQLNREDPDLRGGNGLVIVGAGTIPYRMVRR